MNAHRMIWIPGWAHPPSCMEPLAERVDAQLLSKHAYFHPGGASTAPAPVDSHASVYAAELEQQLRMGIEPATLIGWSMGALIALETALLAPDLVRSLVLISGTACFMHRLDHAEDVRPKRLARMRRSLAKGHALKVLNGFLEDSFHPDIPTQEELAQHHAEGISDGSEALLMGLDYLVGTDFRDAVSALRMPVLLLHGTEDKVIPYDAAEWLDQHLLEARLIAYPGRGHQLIHYEPGVIAGDIVSFLETYL